MKTITQHAREIAMQRFGRLHVSDEQAIATLGQALDEWQATVEARFSMAVMRPPPIPFIRPSDNPMPVFEMGSGKLLGHVGPPIEGSKYQPEPVETEE